MYLRSPCCKTLHALRRGSNTRRLVAECAGLQVAPHLRLLGLSRPGSHAKPYSGAHAYPLACPRFLHPARRPLQPSLTHSRRPTAGEFRDAELRPAPFYLGRERGSVSLYKYRTLRRLLQDPMLPIPDIWALAPTPSMAPALSAWAACID